MTLLNPLALAFAALLPLIVVLYLLKLRRQPAQVSTLMFWQRVTADNRRRALFQRLRQILSLLLHLLIFGLLLLALARPEFASFRGAQAGLTTVVVLDARARMQARTSNGETRFAQARRIAEGYLRRASPRQPFLLVAAGSAPRVVVGLSGDERALLDGLDGIHPSDAGGKIEDAMALASGLVATRPGAHRVIVVTDRAPALPPADAIKDVDIETCLIPAANESPRENVGITRLTARALPNSPETDEVLIEVENFGKERQAGGVELSFEGQLLDVKPFDLAPGEHRADIYPALGSRSAVANPRGWLTAHLVPATASKANAGNGDAYAPDDDAYAVVPPPRPLRVLLVTRGNWFLESLLKADHRLQFDQLTPDAFQLPQAAGFDAVILDDFLPATLETDPNPDRLPAGNFLFIGRAPLPPAPPQPGDAGADSKNAAPGLDHPIITDLDSGSPLTRLTNFHDVTVIHASAWIVPQNGVDAPRPGPGNPGSGIGSGSGDAWRYTEPVRSLDRPLVVTGERGVRAVPPASQAGGRAASTQRFVAVAFGAADSDLPLRVAFPLFIRNSLQWLAGRDDSEDGAALSIRAGDTIPLATGESLWTRAQRGYAPLPANGIPPPERIDGPAVFQPLVNGFYLRRGPDDAETWFAVNTSDREMSTLNAPDGSAAPGGSGAPAPEVERSYGAPLAATIAGWWQAARVWPLWTDLAVLALALFTLEWWGFHRRRTE